MSATATVNWVKFGHGGGLQTNRILLIKVKNGSSKITKNYQKLMELIVLSFYWDHKKVWK